MTKTQNKQNPKVFLKTFGCQMNFHDSEILTGMLEGQGWRRVGEESEADVILLNTCSVRRHAEERVLGKLAEYGVRKQSRPRLVVGVLGCMAQIWGQKLWERFPWLDLIMGPGSFISLPEALEKIFRSGGRRLEIKFLREGDFFNQTHARNSRVKAWVTIMRGCNNLCSYCIVPYARGREISRSPESIVREIQQLARQGYQEVTLLGQNVNSYCGLEHTGRKVNFPELLRLVHGISGIERIRFITSHPKDISSELILVMKNLPKICEYLHFPAQSGSNNILKKMKRGYTREDYLEKVKRLRQEVPGIAISSDFIVGFPGETDPDFEATLNLSKEVQFDQYFIFKYSPRPGTAALRFPDDVRKEVKEARHRILLAEQNQISLAKNRELLGKEVEILVEGTSKTRADRRQGRTRSNRIAIFPHKDNLKGKLIRRKVKRVTARALYC